MRRLLTGPVLPSLETTAIDSLIESVDTHPQSVLHVTPQNHPTEATRDRWNAAAPSAMASVLTLDDIVSTAYRRDQYKSDITHIDRPLLFRLVELGIEGIDSPENPLYSGDTLASAGLVEAAEDLFTNLEFAGLLSSTEMQTRLEAEGLDERAAHVAELAAEIETARTELLAEEFPETYRTERMEHVTTECSLSELFPSVEAVLISGFTRFEALERAFLEQLVETWPTVAVAAKQVDTDDVAGVDAGTARAIATYLELDFEQEYHEPAPSPRTAGRRRLTRNLYRHPSVGPSVSDIDSTELDLTVAEPETVPEELRSVARDIRVRLAEGTPPEEIGIVLTNPVQYAAQIQEFFEAYDIPFHIETDQPLAETALGDAVTAISALAEEPRAVDDLLGLLTNPLVAVDHSDVDHRAIARIAARADTNRLASTLAYADESVTAGVESLLRDVEALATTSLETLPAQLETLFTRLGIDTALEGEPTLSRGRLNREQKAKSSLDRVLETLAMTAPLADLEAGDAIARLERALNGVSVRGTNGGTDQHVVICGLADAPPRAFEQVYLLGMTASHVPSDPPESAFTRPIYEAHADFEQRDIAAEARSHVRTLLSSEATLYLSIPQRSTDGEPYVEADILTELRRLVDLSPVTIDTDASPPGSPEDAQRAIGGLPTTDVERTTALVEDGVAAGTFTPSEHARINSGTACAVARADPEQLTPYDGVLTPETVAMVHDEADREPYSASRLETYAACGFKYYMQRVVEIDAPDSLTPEPDAGERGTYIHDVLEHYYLKLQSSIGEPVAPDGDFETRQQHLLDVALERLETAFKTAGDTAFQHHWLTTVLAGLDSPTENDYYGPDRQTATGQPVARGLLYRFLEHEFGEVAKTTARPAWFEGRVGTPYDAGTPLQDAPAEIETPHGSVPVHGLIDRIDVVPGTRPTQLVVRDYKTGSSIPDDSDSLLGTSFQLPLYALLAEDALPAETVGGTYYQISSPSSVSSRKGLVTSQSMAVHHGSDDIGTPLVRHTYPYFETHAAFRRFIEETTPRRLGQLTNGIATGQFQPTILDPSDAGCRFCDYAHVCDVRSHQRRELIDTIDAEDHPVYVPPKAREQSAEDVVPAEVE